MVVFTVDAPVLVMLIYHGIVDRGSVRRKPLYLILISKSCFDNLGQNCEVADMTLDNFPFSVPSISALFKFVKRSVESI